MEIVKVVEKTCRIIWGRCRAGVQALRGLGTRWGWLAQMYGIHRASVMTQRAPKANIENKTFFLSESLKYYNFLTEILKVQMSIDGFL